MFSVRIKSLISLALASCWRCTQALALLIPVLSGPTNLGAQVLPASCSCPQPHIFSADGVSTRTEISLLFARQSVKGKRQSASFPVCRRCEQGRHRCLRARGPWRGQAGRAAGQPQFPASLLRTVPASNWLPGRTFIIIHLLHLPASRHGALPLNELESVPCRPRTRPPLYSSRPVPPLAGAVSLDGTAATPLGAG